MKNNKLHQIRTPVLRALCAALIVLASANTALAQDWRFEPIFRVGGDFDDNAILDSRTDREIDLSGFQADVRANVYYSSPKTSFLLQPRVNVRNYNDDVILDSDDYYLRSEFRRRGELNTFGFLVNFDRQSVRTGERLDSDLEIENPDEIANDDTGRVFLTGDRDRWRVSPYWEYHMSSVATIGANFHFYDSQYDDVFAGVLSNYSDERLGLSYRRLLSNITTWNISISGSKYDSEDLPDEINRYGLYAGIERNVSEKTRIRARIGFEDTKRSGFETDPEIAGNITLIRNLETIRLLAQYRRTVTGNGSGTVSVRDSVNLNFRRRLNEKISAGLGVRAYHTQGVSGSFVEEDRNYVQLQWSLNWYLSRSLVIQTEYRYTVIDRGESQGGRANSNRVGLWFIYQPNTVPEI
jgi:hypothetical protein